MTKEEFEAMGITSHDLVCVKCEYDEKIFAQHKQMFVGFIEYTSFDDFIYIQNGIKNNSFADEFNREKSLSFVKSIEIIKKDFWK